MKISHGKWSIESAGWKVDDDSECTTLTPADTDAALQISAFTKMSGRITKEEILHQAQKYFDGKSKIRECRCGDFSGYTGEFLDQDDDEATFSRAFLVFSEDLHLFITYNTAPSTSDAHTNVVDWMLGTLAHIDK